MREALALVDQICGELPTIKELRRLRDELMVYPARVTALLRTLCLMAFLDWQAAPSPEDKIRRIERWAYVSEKIAYEHCLRRRRWRKSNG